MPHYNDAPDPNEIDPPAEEWKPTYWTAMRSDRTMGDTIADWAEEFMRPPRRKKKLTILDEEDVEEGEEPEEDEELEGEEPEEEEDDGEAWKILPWQRWWLRHAFELNKYGLMRFQRIYLQIPRKNGKSFLASIILLYWLFTAEDGDEFYCAAKNSKQARIVFKVCRDAVLASPALQEVIKVTRDKLENKHTNAWLEPLSGDSGGFHGKAPKGTSADELHKWDSLTGTSNRGEDMVAAATTGSADRDEWFFLGITTTGDNDTGIAHNMWDYGRKVATDPENTDYSFCFTSWEAEDDDDIYSPATWRKANPNIEAGLMSEEDMEKALTAAEASKGGTADFERYHLNKWVRGGMQADFITGAQWENAKRPELGKIAIDSEICVGFDGSLTEDSTGIVAMDERGLVEILYAWEKDPLDPEWFVDVEEVNAAMVKVFRDYRVLKVYADPSRHQETVKGWRKAYGSNIVTDIPPSSSRNVPMSQEFKAGVLSGKVFHVGERRLTEHVRNAIETIKGVPNKESRNSPRKIDFLACAILAHGAWTEVKDKKNRKAKKARLL